MEVRYFRILKADPIGDEWSANGGVFQSFWCQFEGIEEGVKVNKKVGNTPSLTYGQFGYLTEQTTKSGKNAGKKYWQFKGMAAPDDMPAPRYDAADAEVATRPAGRTANPDDFVSRQEFDDLHELVLSLAEKFDQLNGKGDEKKVAEKTSEVDKATLEEIFGGPMGELVDIPDPDLED